MNEQLIRTTASAGALVRYKVRAAFDFIGVEWIEHKSWSESEFIITGTRKQIDAVYDMIGQYNGH